MVNWLRYIHFLIGLNPVTEQNNLGIRPVVEIDLTKVNVGQTGTGAENDGYSLTLK